MKIRIEKTANPSGVAHFDYCAVVDGAEDIKVHSHGSRPLVAIMTLLGRIEEVDWNEDGITSEYALAEGITIEGQAQ